MALDQSITVKFPWWELLLVLVLVVVLAWYTLGRFGGSELAPSIPTDNNQLAPATNDDAVLAARLNQPVNNTADPTADRALLERLNRPQ